MGLLLDADYELLSSSLVLFSDYHVFKSICVCLCQFTVTTLAMTIIETLKSSFIISLLGMSGSFRVNAKIFGNIVSGFAYTVLILR